jgi:hypothetical protein
MMSEITKERSKLTDAYLLLLNRLDKLNEIELYNKRENVVIEENVQEIPAVEESLNDIIDRHNEQFKDEIEVKVEESNIIPKIEIERELDRLPKNKPMSSERATSLISEILKEAGNPLSAKDIYSKLCDRTNHRITKANFTSNLLQRALKKNKNIERATFGYYQYRVKTN